MISNEERVRVTIEDGVADVKLVRGDKMNALDPAMFDALLTTGDQLKEDKSVRAVVLSGEGRAFCAGLDSSNFGKMAGGERSQGTQENDGTGRLEKRTKGIANDPQYAVWVWRDIPVPVIAAVHGVSFGGGFQLALGADMRYAAPGTRFSVMEIKWGLVPDMAGTQLMRHLAREDIVRELSYTGRIFDTDEALEYGLITRKCDDPYQAALETAREIASKNPDAIRANKRIFNDAVYTDAKSGLLMESLEQDKLIGSPNQIEAVKSQLEQRAANFKD